MRVGTHHQSMELSFGINCLIKQVFLHLVAQ